MESPILSQSLGMETLPQATSFLACLFVNLDHRDMTRPNGGENGWEVAPVSVQQNLGRETSVTVDVGLVTSR